jgi:DNA-binding response OmpR family regulator
MPLHVAIESPPPLVLVVEEDAERCRQIRAALSPSFTITVVNGPAAAIELGTAFPPDLFVVGDQGEPALRIRLHPGLHEVPILLVLDDARRKGEILRRAAQDYVQWPFDDEELRVRAKNLATMKRARDILRRDLGSEQTGLEALAREAVQKRHELLAEVAEARRQRDRAEIVSRTKTAYLRTVGHELAVPLASLQEALRRVERFGDVPPSSKTAESMNDIESSVDWIGELSKALLEYARVEKEAD